MRVNCCSYTLSGFKTCAGAFNLNFSKVIGVHEGIFHEVDCNVNSLGSITETKELFLFYAYLESANGYSTRIAFNFNSEEEALKTFEEISNKMGNNNAKS